ncbi:CLIP domain-containing serine protease 14D [Nasonia vitripennis]|uniref:CLIP domain-containing serine protease n=1 Tax=Nasonia vitripennis TaxID=7425 RepID=A0A7M7TB68_NASVI|nr:CLIP domain-containing serine protease 14D [Nasonia vitripennis]
MVRIGRAASILPPIHYAVVAEFSSKRSRALIHIASLRIRCSRRYRKMRLLIIAVILAMTLAKSSEACLSRLGTRGQCISLKKCRPVLQVLRTRPPLKVYDDIMNTHCGYDGNLPKICCELQASVNTPRPSQRPSQRPSRRRPNRIGKLPKIRFTTSIWETTSTTSSAPAAVAGAPHPNLDLLDHKLCGHIAPELRIYGGSESKLFEFPWMALLAFDSGEQTSDGKPDFRCGATIINKKYVLTAAHCVTNLPEDLKLAGVRVGEHNLAEKRDCEIYDNGAAYICAEKHQDFGIESVHPHPEYAHNRTLQNDIAIVRINGTMNFRPASVRPICLPIDADSRNPGSFGVVTGWGSTETGASNSDVLLKVKLPIVPASECRNAYRDNPFVRLGDGQICAGSLEGKDSCSGDSGGPLQNAAIYRGEPRIVQHGIVSFGKKNCAVEGSPGVYTNVAHYVDWILDNLRA